MTLKPAHLICATLLLIMGIANVLIHQPN